FPAFNAFLKGLMATLLLAYVVQVIATGWLGLPLTQLIVLHTASPTPLWLLQLLTYPFAFDPGPGGVGSFLISMLFAYWIYGDFQQSYGTRYSLQLGLAATVGVGVMTLAFASVFGAREPLFGFNTILWAVIACVAWLARGRPMQLFGVIPIKGGEQFLLLLVGVSVLFFLPTRSVVGLVSNLSALAVGVAFAHFMSGGFGRRRRPKPKKK